MHKGLINFLTKLYKVILHFWLVYCMIFRVYNLLVADIMKTNLYYISYHSKYADLKALLERSDIRSYPLVDSEGKM